MIGESKAAISFHILMGAALDLGFELLLLCVPVIATLLLCATVSFKPLSGRPGLEEHNDVLIWGPSSRESKGASLCAVCRLLAFRPSCLTIRKGL
jgi:hypothetical protein